MRICFIGDSHLGHVKPAWDKLKVNLSNVSIGFHVERTYGTKPLVIRSGTEDDSPTTVINEINLAHSPEVNCEDWDVFVVFGMHYSIASLATLYRSYRSEGYANDSGVYELTDHAYRCALTDLYDSTKASTVIHALQQNTDRPVYYSQQAHPLRWVAERPDLDQKQFAEILANNDDVRLAQDYEQTLEMLEQRGVTVMRQPDSTKHGPIFTRNEYGLADREDSSTESAYAKGDFFHMNSLYGELVLNRLLSRLGVGT